jgi:hypothetical protein
VGQPTLFDSTEAVLADDDRGRIGYTPGFIDAATAEAWFAELRSGVNWRSERRMMYDREVDVPRLVGHFRLDSPDDSTPAPILEAARRVVERLDVPFNSVAPHNDPASRSFANSCDEGCGWADWGGVRRRGVRPERIR